MTLNNLDIGTQTDVTKTGGGGTANDQQLSDVITGIRYYHTSSPYTRVLITTNIIAIPGNYDDYPVSGISTSGYETIVRSVSLRVNTASGNTGDTITVTPWIGTFASEAVAFPATSALADGNTFHVPVYSGYTPAGTEWRIQFESSSATAAWSKVNVSVLCWHRRRS